MFVQDIIGNTSRATLLKSQAVTGTVNGPGVDLRPYRGNVMLLLNCAAATAGTNPTFDCKLQESDTEGGSYTDVSGKTFTQVTDADSLQAMTVDPDTVKAWVRLVTTIGGTSSPSFPAGAVLVGIPQRVT